MLSVSVNVCGFPGVLGGGDSPFGERGYIAKLLRPCRGSGAKKFGGLDFLFRSRFFFRRSFIEVSSVVEVAIHRKRPAPGFARRGQNERQSVSPAFPVRNL